MPQQLVLRRPRQDEEDEFMRAHRATTPEFPSFLHYYQEGMPFSRYLEVLDEQERGVNLPPNHVPSTFLFAFKDERIVGRVSIRHMLNDFLLRVGGHIGYVVVPDFRRQGHATMILRLALHIAREKLGIGRVLVTCDDDNVGSIRTIERNGGVLENVITGPGLDKPKRRYWIEAGGVGTHGTRSDMPDAPALLDALLDSWDRNNTILVNLLRAIPEGGLEARAMEGSPSIARLFTHIHFVRLVFVSEDAPEAARELPEEEWKPERDPARIAEMLNESAKAVRDAVKGRLEAGRDMDLHYDHPILMLQHLIWHEGYHHGQVKLALKLAGRPLSDDEAGPLTWDVWMEKT